jgi:hypothetical protein
MDLVSFISGIGPTQSFSPGVSTDPALAGPHTGLTDGTSPTTASSNMAEIYNRLLLQVASVIVKSGLTVDNTNWSQLADAVTAMATNSSIGGGQTITNFVIGAGAGERGENIWYTNASSRTIVAYVSSLGFEYGSFLGYIAASSGGSPPLTVQGAGSWNGGAFNTIVPLVLIVPPGYSYKVVRSSGGGTSGVPMNWAELS